ncbi:MAG: DUF294 nucleotidyltransferase-like domain-containing protein, partial [Burkholderiaceae bacterium]
MPGVQELRESYRLSKQAVQQSVANSGASTHGVHTALNRLSALADKLLQLLWQQVHLGGPFALVAVGGYGRGELFPHSDVDVLVLLPDARAHDNDSALQASIEAFISSCWDAGLEIGSSVRTVSQCLIESQKDVTVQTALLESRLVCGDSELFAHLGRDLQRALDPRAFFVAKTLEMRQRHSKYEDTPYA